MFNCLIVEFDREEEKEKRENKFAGKVFLYIISTMFIYYLIICISS